MSGRFLFLFFFSFLGLTAAQDHDYIQYTSKDGLPSNYVYGVIEDADGYIWAYTENGMSKFDGYAFQNFSTKDGMPGNDVVFCLKDKEDKIWLYTYNNKPAYLENDSFHVIYDEVCVPAGLFDGTIRYGCANSALLSFESGQLKTSTSGLIDSVLLQQEAAAFQLDSVRALEDNWDESGFFPHLSPFVHISNDSAFHYGESFENAAFYRNFKEEYFFYFPISGMVYWKNNTHKKSFYIGGSEFSRLGYRIEQLGPGYRYLIGADGSNELLLIDIEKESSKRILFRQQGVMTISSNPITIMDSTFFIRIDQVFLEYDFDGNCIDKLGAKYLLENYSLLRSYKDSKGNLWIGSREGGLFFIPKQKRKTTLLTSAYDKDKSFEQFITTNDGQLLGITDNSGVYLIKEDSLINLLPVKKKLRFRSAVNTPFGILMSGSSNAYLIKNSGDGFSFSPFNETFRIQNELEIEAISSYSSQLVKLYNSNLGYNPGDSSLFISFGQSNWFHQPLSKKLGKPIRSKIVVNSFFYHPIKKVFYGGNADGLYFYKKGSFIPFLQQFEELKNISSIYGSADKLWIGTESDGLFAWDFSTKKLSKTTSAPMIRRIRPDTDTTILVASNAGVLVVNKNATDDAKTITYTINDGLLSNEIQDVHSDGKQFIYVASSEGLHKVDRTTDFESTIAQTNLQIKSVLVNKKSVSFSEDLDLSHLENTLDIRYQLLSYASNSDIKYFTRLAPLEKDWQESGKPQQRNYLSLAPNEYTFHLKAQDVYDNEVILEKPLVIKIRKAFWQTSLFKGLMTFIAIGLVSGIIYYRDKISRRTIAKEKEINRRMADLELSALRAQMNPHFVFNALGAIQYFIQTNEVEAADNYLTRFARLMRKYLDSSKQKMISLHDEIELLTIYTDLEKLRFEDLFNVEIKISNDIQLEDSFIPTMLIQPFVENAINHGLNERRDKKGFLLIHFSKQNDQLSCTIKDNGIGRKNAAKNKRKGHKSKGLGIIKEKIDTLKKSGLMNVIVNTENVDSDNNIFPGTMVTLVFQNMADEDED